VLLKLLLVIVLMRMSGMLTNKHYYLFSLINQSIDHQSISIIIIIIIKESKEVDLFSVHFSISFFIIQPSPLTFFVVFVVVVVVDK